MTDDMMNLRALVEKSSDADLLREMIGFAAERLMELEVGAATGAGYGEKNPLRLAQRNGYRDRDWETRAGTVELRIPLEMLSPTRPRQGTRWRLNLYRCDKANHGSLAWSPVLHESFHTPEKFGVLQFVE